MNIVIIGAGAMGCLFGALLAPVARVTLYSRQQSLARIIRVRGVKIRHMDGRQEQIPVASLHDLETAPKRTFDLALVCTKSAGTAQAAETAQLLLRPDGLALSLQNGLGNREILIDKLGPERVIQGVTAQAATLLEPGSVRHAGAGLTLLAPTGNTQRLKAFDLVQLFGRAGIETELEDDPDALVWGKLLVNAAINAAAALLRVPNGALARNGDCRAIMHDAVAEGVAVARALGVDLAEDIDPLAQALAVCEQTAGNHCSTLQDVLRGQTGEIDAINGAIVRLGAEYGVATPVNATLARLVRALEATASERVDAPRHFN